MTAPDLAKPRAAVFIDGSNFYRACVSRTTGAGVLCAADYYDIDFAALARKLAGPGQEVVGVRYYVAQLKKEGKIALYDRQQSFFTDLERDGVVCRTGRMVKRPMENKTAEGLSELLKSEPLQGGELNPGIRRELNKLRRRAMAGPLGPWLGELSLRGIRLPPALYSKLREIHKRQRENTVWQEKAVDVKLAVDMLSMAHRDEYEVAYLLSQDGDYTPVMEEVRAMGRTVIAASPGPRPREGSAFGAAIDDFIPMDGDFFTGLPRKRGGKK